MKECVFCKIIKGEIPSEKIYENKDVFAFLDINPYVSGHTLVMPKAHYPDLKETPTETLCELMKIVKDIAPAIIKGVGAEAFNIGINNGETAGQEIPHLHIHIIPRFPQDGLEHWTDKTSYKEGEISQVAEKIRIEI